MAANKNKLIVFSIVILSLLFFFVTIFFLIFTELQETGIYKEEALENDLFLAGMISFLNY